MNQREVVVTFRDIPDGRRTAGWLCWIGTGDYVDGVPLGRGGTIPEAFDFLIERIAEAEIERVFRSYGNEVKK